MTEIEQRFQGVNTMLAVIRTSRTLEAEGFDRAEVNAVATKRRRELLALNSNDYQMLKKVFAPVMSNTQRVSRINTVFQDMTGSALCIVQKTGEFVWK